MRGTGWPKLDDDDESQSQWSDSLNRIFGNDFRASTARQIARDVDMESILQQARQYLSVHPTEDLNRISSEEYDIDRFRTAFVATGTPCMITGLTGTWPAKDRWQSSSRFREEHGTIPFKMTEMIAPHGHGTPLPVRIPLWMFLQYSEDNDADNPFYAFGDDFGEERAAFLDDYTVPSYFSQDVYSHCEKLREMFPRYRYMVIGGPRTGTNMHIDPALTAAWNTLLCGYKLWVLGPPSSDPDVLATLGISTNCDGPVDPPTIWWLETFPKLIASVSNRNDSDVDVSPGTLAEQLGMRFCIQAPGETIYVPSLWWHAVLNFGELTIAITQNLLDPATLPLVWERMVSEKPAHAKLVSSLLVPAGAGPGQSAMTDDRLHPSPSPSPPHLADAVDPTFLRKVILPYATANTVKATSDDPDSVPTNQPLLYLHIDGVLAPLGSSETATSVSSGADANVIPGTRFLVSAVTNLQAIILRTQAQIVLCDRWRSIPELRDVVAKILWDYQIPVHSWTTTAALPEGCGAQIMDHLSTRGDAPAWAVVAPTPAPVSQSMLLQAVYSCWHNVDAGCLQEQDVPVIVDLLLSGDD